MSLGPCILLPPQDMYETDKILLEPTMLELPIHSHTPDAAYITMYGTEQSPEEVCWAQSADSLVLSVSPVAPLTNNTLEDDGVLGHPSCRDDDKIDFDEPLAGELIWDEIKDNGNLEDSPRQYSQMDDSNMTRNFEVQSEHTYSGRGRGQHGNADVETDHTRESTATHCQYHPEVVGRGRRDYVVTEISRGNDRVESDPFEDAEDRSHEYEEDGVYERASVDYENYGPAWDERIPADNNDLDLTRDGGGRLEFYESPRLLHRQEQSQEPSRLCLDGGFDVNLEMGGRPTTVNDGLPRPIRSNLDRERRKLDRLPRSQRLNRVKGHPLGGMTLLELEERQLLDVGIGEMTRLLAHRHRRAHRRVDADLLRRSARLLRRAQMERETRTSFAQQRNQQGHHVSVANGKHRKGRRPASASRDCSSPRSSPVALSSEGNEARLGAREDDLESDRIRNVVNGCNPQMGLYSGGGVRCSLRHKRPLSAKPALTCGSGWQPGRARVRRRRGEHPSPGNRGIAGFEDQRTPGAGDSDGSERSDVSDLSLNGIVEYDDEEGPFNEDELEQVASSYLRRRYDPLRQASLMEDERLADDGSVYIYREGDLEYEHRRDEGDTGRSRGNKTYDRYWQEHCNCGQPVEEVQAEEHDHGARSRNVTCNDGIDWGRDASDLVQDTRIASATNRDIAPKQAPSVADIGRSASIASHGNLNEIGREDRERRGSESQVFRMGDVKGKNGGQPQIGDTPVSLGVRPRRDTSEMGEGVAHCPEHAEYTEDAPETIVPVPRAGHEPVAPDDEGEGRAQSAKISAATDEAHKNVKLKRVAHRLRQMILERQASAGRSMRQVFTHFDRRGCGYVNNEDMRSALADLRLNLSPVEAQDFLRMMALDGGDRLSYAEFAVFVSDPRHADLQSEVCRQISKQLESLGRRSLHLDDVFFARQRHRTPTEGIIVDPRSTKATPRSDNAARHLSEEQPRGYLRGHRIQRHQERQMIAASDFLDGLGDVGLRLSAVDANRLLVRFDVHGDGYISVLRFVSMVESSPEWSRALARLTRQEEADEEADACLRARRTRGNGPQSEHLSEDLIKMARHLGIRVSSDSSLLWIAEDALKAPLPGGWVVSRSHKDGTCFYQNIFTGESRWDHPLDPHFRRLYLHERFGEGYDDSEDSVVSNAMRQSFAVSSRGRKTIGPTRASLEGSSHPSRLLEPRRVRPSLRDFTPKKAMEILRTRKPNNEYSRVVTGISGGTHRSTTRRQDQGRAEREAWTGVRRATDSGRPLRRRPVSASALRESSGDSRDRVNISNSSLDGEGFSSPPPLGGVVEEGRATRGASDCAASTRPRRPFSAKAALQRPHRDRQSVDHRKETRAGNHGRVQTRIKDDSGGSCRSPEGTWMNTEGEQPLPGKRCGADRRSQFRGDWDVAPRERPRRGIVEPDDDRERISMTEQNSLSGEDSLGSSTATDDCAWLVERLTDLCRRLSDTEMASASQSPSEVSRRHSRGPEVRGVHPPGHRSDQHREHVSPGPLQCEDSMASSRDVPQHGDDGHMSPDEKLRHHVVSLESRIQSLETQLRGDDQVEDNAQSRKAHRTSGAEAIRMASDRYEWDKGHRRDITGTHEDISERGATAKRGNNTPSKPWICSDKEGGKSARAAPSGKCAERLLFDGRGRQTPTNRGAEMTPNTRRPSASSRRKGGGIVLI